MASNSKAAGRSPAASSLSGYCRFGRDALRCHPRLNRGGHLVDLAGEDTLSPSGDLGVDGLVGHVRQRRVE